VLETRVFRGVGFSRSAFGIFSIALGYGGAFAVLWGLGLVVRGWQGWLLLGAPLAAWIAARAWSFRRVSVEVGTRELRYEGVSPREDFAVPLERIASVYFDETLRGRPLVLVLDDGDERVCGELSPRAARSLHTHLLSKGVKEITRSRSNGS
jgi:hypothetical protein